MATVEEDFSFPATTTDSPPRCIDSPPLWRYAAAPSPTSHDLKPEKLKGKEVNNEEKKLALTPSFQEEKMDMLWEDLNDECSRSSGKIAQNCEVSSPGREGQISCVKALKLSTTNGHMISGKKPNILVFIKVLKKVFLMHNSHRTIKKRSW